MSSGAPARGFLAAAVIAIAVAGCSSPPAPKEIPIQFASAEQIEQTFRGKQFVLGDNSMIALVRAPDWPADQWLKLQFWFGINVMVPGVLQPKPGQYYVISEARLVKQLSPEEWMIEAGSSLIKKETVLQTGRIHFLTDGKILPLVVQYQGLRDFKTEDGKMAQVPVLHEVSLPMKWTLGGHIPDGYARYHIS